ncbi:unnamed protein product [Macrosiphum euphorbiae]|uniref:Uncharacterized protein n=1 Tax=Macrosiphum euphorbiae TaxID=13131 RepID=A0AAV0Y6A1_9HEMI|nr:unnamed protein product [Macrosiphum euphorbiae]
MKRVLFKNPIDTRKNNVYATPYSCDIREPETRMVSVDGTKNLQKVHVMGIPTGVSPYVNETLVDGAERRRFYIFSENKLTEDLIRLMTQHHKLEPYDVPRFQTPCGRVDQQPSTNFYVYDQRASNDHASFFEYRYFRQRYCEANAIFDPASKNVYRFVLPDECVAPLAFIMPENYVAISPKRGYIMFETGIIIHFFTKHFMLAKNALSPANASKPAVVTNNAHRKPVKLRQRKIQQARVFKHVQRGSETACGVRQIRHGRSG